MADSKKGTIVSFQKEQGFGKVAVEGSGELPFDAVVSVAKPHELVPGAKVNVEIGPSRIPGRVKVTKVWLESSSGDTKDPGDLGPDTKLMVGAYEVHLPGFWKDKESKVREEPGKFSYSAKVTDGVSFDFFVFVGAASDLDHKARVVRGYVDGHNSPRHMTKDDVMVQGASFEMHRFEGSKSLGEGVAHELYVGNVYADRLVFGFAASMSDSRQASFRELFKTMVGTAIVRRTSELAGPKT